MLRYRILIAICHIGPVAILVPVNKQVEEPYTGQLRIITVQPDVNILPPRQQFRRLCPVLGCYLRRRQNIRKMRAVMCQAYWVPAGYNPSSTSPILGSGLFGNEYGIVPHSSLLY